MIRHVMRKLFFILMFFLSSFFVKKSYTQTIGCFQQSTSTVFRDEGLLGIWGGRTLSTLCAPGAGPSTKYASIVVNSTTYCNIGILGSGVLVRYNELNCNLDLYIILLIIPITLFGYWRIKIRS